MNVTAKYLIQVYPDGTYGLDDFSAEIKSGDFVTVLGESGCGKTTLLRVLAGLEKPCAGELYFDGVLHSEIPLKSRRTAMVFQEYVLYPKFTVWDNIRTALDRYSLDQADEDRRIKKVLRDFDLLSVAGQLPRYLSGGQQQRVALAKAVVTEPELLLFDEPLSNVAESMRTEYMRIIRELKERLPATTFVYVTHNVKEALTMGNKLLVMGGGRVLQYGDPIHVARHPHGIEVMRQIYETDERTVVIKDGKDVEGLIKIPASVSDGEVTAVTVPSDDTVYLFDRCGKNLVPDPEQLRLDATYDGKVLRVCGEEIDPGADFPQRFMGEYGKLFTLVLPVSALTDTPEDGYVSLTIKTLGVDSARFSGDKAYFDPDKADLLDKDGARILAHYRVYQAFCEGRVRGGILRMPCGSMPFGGRDGKVRVCVKRGARGDIRAKCGLKMQCIAEDDCGSYRLAYLRMPGFDNYVTLRIDKECRAYVKKARAVIDAEDISVEYI